MSPLQWLFGFHGRINAAKFRQGGALMGFVVGMLFAATGAGIGAAGLGSEPRTKVILLLVIWGALIVLLIWSNAALQAKRLHDRGRSGFLALISVFIFLIWVGVLAVVARESFLTHGGELEASANFPAVLEQCANILLPLGGVSTLISFWVFIDLGLLPGTPAPNQFGPEPGESGGSPGGGAQSASRQSWLAPKQSTKSSSSSWDVSGADAAIANAIAERNSKGAPTGGETRKEITQGQSSNGVARGSFGRRI